MLITNILLFLILIVITAIGLWMLTLEKKEEKPECKEPTVEFVGEDEDGNWLYKVN